LDACFR